MMQTYIGVKMVEAEPMTFGEYRQSLGWIVPEGMDPDKEGYKVKYHPDGHVSWSSKDVFEAVYFPIERDDELTEDDVRIFINMGKESCEMDAGKTVVTVRCPTEWKEYEVWSSCDHRRTCSAGNIKENIWKHLAFVMAWAKYGLK